MAHGVELVPGERFSFMHGEVKQHLTYFKSTADGRLVFVDELSGREKPFKAEQFVKARLKGTLKKVLEQIAKTRLDPDIYADENADGITNRRRAEIRRKKKKYRKALTLRFYVVKHDETPDAKKTTPKLQAFIKRHYDEALGFGFGWLPSASEVRKALRKARRQTFRPQRDISDSAQAALVESEGELSHDRGGVPTLDPIVEPIVDSKAYLARLAADLD